MTVRSLKARLALAVAAVVTLLWLGAAFSTSRLVLDEMNEVFDSALQETGQRILQLAVIDILGREEEGVAQHVTALDEHEEYFTYVVRDRAGRVLLTSHAADPQDFPTFATPGFHDTDTRRIYQESAVQGTITLSIGEPLTHRAEVAHEVQTGLALPLLLVIPLGLLGIVLVVRRSLRPLERLRSQVARRDANDLAPLPEADLPSELQPIAGTMNQLFQRLTAAFAAERSFASNAAHELRTPLAGAIAQVQRLRQETADPVATARAAEIEATLKRLTRLSERLMQLARAEGARLRADQPGDLRQILDLVIRDFPLDGRARITLDPAAGPILSAIDPDIFAILCRNLIDNALRHGQGPARVRLSGTLNPPGSLSLCVENDADPVSAEVLAQLGQRFARAPAAGEGSGLGLAIVHTIAERLGGTLTLTSPVPGTQRGFVACVSVAGLAVRS